MSNSDCEALSLKDTLAIADKDSLALWENLSLGYTETLGHPLLRKEISKLYKSIDYNEHIITCAPEEGIITTK